MSELDDLRKLARTRHRAANNKVSRLKNDKGVIIAGSDYDPRRNLTAIKRYNKTQLNAYINQLNAFTGRKTQFVSGVEGQPLSAAKWSEYKAAENAYNQIAGKYMKSIGDIVIPGSGLTVAQREAAMRNTMFGVDKSASNRRFSPRDRNPSNVNGDKALDTLIKEMRVKSTRKYSRQETARGRYEAQKMLDALGDARLSASLRNTDDDAFNLLWHHTSFANDLSEDYAMHGLQLTGTKDDLFDAIGDDRDITGAIELIKWAKTETANRRKSNKGKPGR